MRALWPDTLPTATITANNNGGRMGQEGKDAVGWLAGWHYAECGSRMKDVRSFSSAAQQPAAYTLD